MLGKLSSHLSAQSSVFCVPLICQSRPGGWLSNHSRHTQNKLAHTCPLPVAVFHLSELVLSLLTGFFASCHKFFPSYTRQPLTGHMPATCTITVVPLSLHYLGFDLVLLPSRCLPTCSKMHLNPNKCSRKSRQANLSFCFPNRCSSEFRGPSFSRTTLMLNLLYSVTEMCHARSTRLECLHAIAA